MATSVSRQLHPGLVRNLKIIGTITALIIIGGIIALKTMKRQPMPFAQMNIATLDAQGGEPAPETPHYTQALMRVNQQKLAQAEKNNNTFIPGLSDRMGHVEIEQQLKEREQASLGKRDEAYLRNAPHREDAQSLPSLPTPSQGVTQQVQALIATWDNPPQSQQVLELQNQLRDTTALSAAMSSSANQVASAVEPAKKSILNAADKYYAHLENGIDTDAPSDVLAVLDQGPCKGGRLMGSGKLTNEVVTATFTTLSCQGQTVSVNAVALNDETLTNALPAQINHRYAQRVGIPALLGGLGAAGAVYGHAGSTVTQSPLGGYTEVTNPNPSIKQITGAMAAGGIQATQNVVQQQASSIPPRRGRVAANLPVLILFKSDVFLE